MSAAYGHRSSGGEARENETRESRQCWTGAKWVNVLQFSCYYPVLLFYSVVLCIAQGVYYQGNCIRPFLQQWCQEVKQVRLELILCRFSLNFWYYRSLVIVEICVVKIAFWVSVTVLLGHLCINVYCISCCYCLCNVFLGCHVVSDLKFVKLCFLTCHLVQLREVEGS